MSLGELAFFIVPTYRYLCQAAQKMIKRLQQLPHENDDKNQNIDDDDLAQVETLHTYLPVSSGLQKKFEKNNKQ